MNEENYLSQYDHLTHADVHWLTSGERFDTTQKILFLLTKENWNPMYWAKTSPAARLALWDSLSREERESLLVRHDELCEEGR